MTVLFALFTVQPALSIYWLDYILTYGGSTSGKEVTPRPVLIVSPTQFHIVYTGILSMGTRWLGR
jgi:hypothetical protein